jgi:hypothetical protein
MLEPIDDLPDGVVGFRASGELSGEDYDRVTGGAMWDDTKLGMAHVTKWEKVALVSDVDWLRHAVVLLGYLMPGQMKAFTTADLDDARAWVVA